MVIGLNSAGGEGGIGWPMAIASDASWAAPLREDKPRSVEPLGSHPSGEQKGSVGLAWLGKFIGLDSAGGEGGIGSALLRGFAPILADCLFGLKALTEPKGSHPSR
jgi:hypothetical protein